MGINSVSGMHYPKTWICCNSRATIRFKLPEALKKQNYDEAAKFAGFKAKRPYPIFEKFTLSATKVKI
jgi:hypothetical protein